MPADAFTHHPELRGLIKDPERSGMRSFDPQAMTASRPELGLGAFLTPVAVRDASRRAALAGHDGDLWVFGYGSLMWDPGFHFTELRRAHVADHARQFIVKDSYGARGTAKRPGVLAALDHGPGCDGLVLRIAAGQVAAETEILWRREMAGSAYRAVFLTASTALGPVRALAFTADHASPAIVADMMRDEQVRFIATGVGFFGSSLEYLTNIAGHFAAMGIEDAEVTSLMHEAAVFQAGSAGDA